MEEKKKYEKDFKDVFKKVGVIWKNQKNYQKQSGEEEIKTYFAFALDGDEKKKKVYMYKNKISKPGQPNYVLKEYVNEEEQEVGAAWEGDNGKLSIKVGADKYSAYKNKYKDNPAYIVYQRIEDDSKEKREDLNKGSVWEKKEGQVDYEETNEEVEYCEENNEDVFFKKAGDLLSE